MFALVLLAAVLVAVGQAQSPAPRPAGLLGQRYAEISGGVIAPADDLFDRGSVGGLGLNVPLAAAVDLNFGYTFSRTTGESVPGMLTPSARETTRRQMAHAGVTAYLRNAAASPFICAAVGQQWLTSERVFPAFRFEPSWSDTVWMIGAGVEFLIERVAITPAISYRSTQRDDSGNDVGGTIVAGLDVHCWFTDSLGGFARLETVRLNDSGRESIGELGLRFRF